MTWREIQSFIEGLPKEQLDMEATIYKINKDRFYFIQEADFTRYSNRVVDIGSPYFRMGPHIQPLPDHI